MCLFYGITTIIQFVYSTPRADETWLIHLAGPEEEKSVKLSVAIAAFGLLADIFLIVVPLGAVVQSRLPTGKKIGVGLIFLTGLL